MNEMTLSGLLRSFGSHFAKHEASHVILVLEGIGPEPEIIIDPAANFEAKAEYFKNAYMENLTLRVNPNIKVIGYNFVEDLREFFVDDEDE